MIAARIDSREIAALTKALAGSSPQLRRQLPGRMRRIGLAAQRQAQRNAAWSKRIPGAIRLGAVTRGARAGISLRVDARRAPHARAYEGLAKGGRGRVAFRHPVWGAPEVWVTQPTRRFLIPAVDDNRDRARQGMRELVDQIAAQAGLRRT